MLLITYFAVLFFSIPAALTFLILFAMSRRRACLIAGLLWLFPVPYEFLVQTNCTGECNIRVDLLLVLPLEIIVLYKMSRTAFGSFVEFRRAKKAVSRPDL